jgi:hypothetical protein
MRTDTYTVTDTAALEQIDLSLFKREADLLVQIFCGQEKHFLKQISTYLSEHLPSAHIIGTTTDGEIAQEHITTEHTVISFSSFAQTVLNSTYVRGENAFENGVYLAKSLVEKDTRLLILFSDGTTTNGEAFLKGVESVAKEVVIAGGMAGDNGQFVQTYVSHGGQLLAQGAVGVALNSNHLHVYNDFSFNWSPIGVEHTIDHAEHNRVYSIDDMSPVDFYTKYLGEQVSEALPATGIEFPLITNKDGIDVARAVIARHEDDSLSFAGNLHSGDKVRLGFGNAKMIMKESFASLSETYQYPIESFFVYSCMARRRYMPDFIQIEIKPFARTATTVGFFTYGEFYHHGDHNELLNQTFTVVALSESSDAQYSEQKKRREKPFGDTSGYSTTIEALTHLIDRSTEDYEQQARELEKEKLYSQHLLEAQKTFIRHAIHETNTPLSVIMANIELFELYYGKHPNMVNIEIAAKSIHNIYEDLSYLIKKEQVKYPKKKIDLIDFLRSRLDFFDSIAKRSHIALNLLVGEECSMVFFNETKLQRIVDNNLSNAIKYTEDAEHVSIEVYEEEADVVLCFISRSLPIRDTDSVFEAYYRESALEDGLGLGLNLVKRICDEEGVRITVDSGKEETRFCYYFSKEETR